MKISLLQYDEQEQNQVRKMVMEAFASKFSSVKLSLEQLMALTQLVWSFPKPESKNKQYIGEIEGELAGTIALIRENTLDDEYISMIQLFRQFGFLNVTRLLMCYGVLNHKVSKGEVYIDHIVSDSLMRGRGVGTKLLKMAQQTLEKDERLTLYVAESNPDAQKLYERLGFCVVKKRKSLLRKILIGEAGWYFMEWNAC